MIDVDPDEAIFPNNIVVLVAMAMQTIDPDVAVMKRPLRNEDPQQSIGVAAATWDPQEDSLEMKGIGHPAPQEPTFQRYILTIQAFVKDGDAERGLAVHSVLAQRVRSVLYTNEGLRLALQGLSVEFQNGRTERLQRWGVRTARYFSGEIESQMLYLSTLEFWIETETN